MMVCLLEDWFWLLRRRVASEYHNPGAVPLCPSGYHIHHSDMSSECTFWGSHIKDSLKQTGEICLDVLKSQWSPAWTISAACTAVRALLESPEPDSPLNVDAGTIFVDWRSHSSKPFKVRWSRGLRLLGEDVYTPTRNIGCDQSLKPRHLKRWKLPIRGH